jgi:AraC family transcriptional regulator, transcriptional activator of pobA
MEYKLNTKLDGNIAITYSLHKSPELLRDRSLYKFIWVQKGSLRIVVDHIPLTVRKDEIVSLSPMHHLEFKHDTCIEHDAPETVGNKKDFKQTVYLSLLFNSNFYCIYGHDSEVSCNGFLFNGSSNLMTLKLSKAQSERLHSITDIFMDECGIQDDLQEEMLRIVLKRFIITCTRVARQKYAITKENEKSFEIVRQFYVLVDNNFKEKKQVQDYADMLFRSPKTLSNLFASYKLPSPLQVIHQRIAAEAKRLLLYTNMSAKEIGNILGFEDVATFSRFFKKEESINISDFRIRELK